MVPFSVDVSRYGATTIDIGAPGWSIWSTVSSQPRRNGAIALGDAGYHGTTKARRPRRRSMAGWSAMAA
ncbi:hypothetical protein [Silanimonas sp.]|uniref:hypothetical protein n=1 Tax=Silanimonas sp. TaxID=1929290 RepID=UPI0037C98DB1